MSRLRKNYIRSVLFKYFPLILLFVSIMNDFNFNDLELKYFSFNFSYILIFYYTLKRKEALGYVSLFVAGLFNDVIIGLPMGISSLLFLLQCGLASYLRNITLTPNLFKDWIFFLITLLILNSLSYILLVLIFEYDIDYIKSIFNTFFTFILYFFFTYMFRFIENFFIGFRNAE